MRAQKKGRLATSFFYKAFTNESLSKDWLECVLTRFFSLAALTNAGLFVIASVTRFTNHAFAIEFLFQASERFVD